MKLQLKRSATLVNGAAKPPLASQLAFGEVAINYNATDPKIFIKDSNNSIVSFTDHLLPKAGGTLTGNLILNGDPTSALMPATKQYTDSAVTAVQNSISYPVTSVNNLTGAVSLDYTNVGAPSTSGANATGSNWNISVLGNSATATSLQTARNIALTGDVSGNVNFDGTANVSITTIIADDSHNHVISNIDGLQTALNAKQDAASPSSNSLQLNGKSDSDFVQTTYLSSLNSDSRNSRGVTRLYRRDGDSDYSVQTDWTGSRWRLRGYNGDTFHGECEVSYATSSGTASSATTADSWTTARTITFTGDVLGSVTLDGSTGKSVSMTVQNNSHLHFTNTIQDAQQNTRITFVQNGATEFEDTVDVKSSHFSVKASTLSPRFVVAETFGGNPLTTVYNKLYVSGEIEATGNITAYSDISLKENIEVIPDALSKVLQIRGVSFDRKDIDDSPRFVGVIAQEVEQVLPEVISINDDGIKSVAYSNMVALLIEAVKELKQEVEELKADNIK